MKRHPALVPLSHDHQNALAQALRMRRSGDLPTEQRRTTVDEFLQFAEQRLLPHFAEEERLVGQLAAGIDHAGVAAANERLVAEHGALRASFDRLRSAGDAVAEDPELAVATGARLHDHIRFEERELFELLQDVLRDALGEAVDAASTDPRG